MRKFLFIFFILFVCINCTAQTDTGRRETVSDTARRSRTQTVAKPVQRRVVRDTLRSTNPTASPVIADSTITRDSVIRNGIDSLGGRINGAVPIKPAAIKKPIDSFYLKLLDNPFFRTKAEPIYLVISERQRQAKDEIFYLLAGLLLFLAFIKLVFGKYFNSVFRLFVQPTFRQKQTKEQLQQGALPSFLLNLFFIFSSGAFVAFLIQHFKLVDINFWFILIYSVASFLVLYLGKFLFLSFAGWVFDVKEATNSYIFSVYLINKILGILLIPFTLILAFSPPEVVNISITISLLVISMLFIYRFIMSYAPVRKELKVNIIHFLFYILAFEIVPLLLIYKTLIIFLTKKA